MKMCRVLEKLCGERRQIKVLVTIKNLIEESEMSNGGKKDIKESKEIKTDLHNSAAIRDLEKKIITIGITKAKSSAKVKGWAKRIASEIKVQMVKFWTWIKVTGLIMMKWIIDRALNTFIIKSIISKESVNKCTKKREAKFQYLSFTIRWNKVLELSQRIEERRYKKDVFMKSRWKF